MGVITELDYARVRHKPTGREGLVVPEWFGWRCVSWGRVNVMFEDEHNSAVQMLPVEELEVIERLDPAGVDHNLFSLCSPGNEGINGSG